LLVSLYFCNAIPSIERPSIGARPAVFIRWMALYHAKIEAIEKSKDEKMIPLLIV
jgi:hypothetical protein